MKKVVLWLGILGLLGFGASKLDYFAPSGNLQVRTQAAESPPKEGTPINITKDQVYKGNLLLVNKDYPAPSGGEEARAAVQLIQHKELVKGFGLLDNTIQLSPTMVQRFTAMVNTADRDGVNHFQINSGYRSSKEQNQLYKQMGASYAMPAGYSEHNLGLSVDIGSTQMEMNKAPEGEWLRKHAWKYGFILRYPKDKTDITGIRYEPWHFRYVGLPHSAIIQENSFVLEEYLDFLKENKSVTATIGKRTYTIYYYPVSKNTVIRVPAESRYEISGDNMGGVIVTVYTEH